MKIQAKRYDDRQPVEITIAGSQIESVKSLTIQTAGETLPWVAPGFVDIQVNGYGGHDFCSDDLTPEKVTAVSLAMDQFGCTAYCPTVTTQSQPRMVNALRVIAQACSEDPAAASRVAGIHVEGPFICPDDGPRGAHPKRHVRPPSWDEFQAWQDAAEGRVRLVTLSPEYEGAPQFIKQLSEADVVVAIGHTNATSEQIAAAVDAGASLSTHLGNGAHGTIRRHPNYIWDQLADDRLMASLIVDGHHLPPSVVKSMVRAKTWERCLLVSDMTALAGLPPGDYRGTPLGDVELLDNGRLVVAGQRQYLAGASLPIGVGVENVFRFANAQPEVNPRLSGGLTPFFAAIEMASRRPAELLSLPKVSLRSGSRADLVLFDWLIEQDGNLTVRQTIHSGKVVFKT